MQWNGILQVFCFFVKVKIIIMVLLELCQNYFDPEFVRTQEMVIVIRFYYMNGMTILLIIILVIICV